MVSVLVSKVSSRLTSPVASDSDNNARSHTNRNCGSLRTQAQREDLSERVAGTDTELGKVSHLHRHERDRADDRQ